MKDDISTAFTFLQSPISSYLAKILTHTGYIHQTPIQHHSFQAYLNNENSNLVCRSKSGTGKTIAYLTILLHELLTKNQEIKDRTYAVVLVPTRELAAQIYQTLTQILQFATTLKPISQIEKQHQNKIKKIKPILTIGGLSFQDDRKKYSSQPFQIVISTVGRFWEMLNQNIIIFHTNILIILDEGDKLFQSKDDKFKKCFTLIQYISKKKWLIFSATFTKQILEQIEKCCNFLYVHTLWSNGELNVLITDKMNEIGFNQDENEKGEFGKINMHMANIKKFQIKMKPYENLSVFQSKIKELKQILKHLEYQKCLIFVEKKSFLQQIYESIIEFDPVLMHGSLSQAARFRMMNQINRNKLIISSDLLARGIDIRLDLVILFDAKQTDNFWHRIGRTGRYGREGVVVSMDPITDNQWNLYNQTQINQILRGIVNITEKSWFGGHLTEIGKWSDVNEQSEIKNDYKYFEEPIKNIQNNNNEDNNKKSKNFEISTFATEQQFKLYINKILSCEMCQQIISQTQKLTQYKFKITKQ